MYATHAYGVKARLAFHLNQTLCPVVLDCLAVGDVVVPAAHRLVPLPDIVAQQRFAVGGADEYTAGVSSLTGSRNFEERCRAGVHPRPERVRPQAEQEPEKFAVRVRADGLGILLWGESLRAPRPEGPVLIVEEESPVFHRRMLECAEPFRQLKPVALLRTGIAPPYPRGDAGKARELKSSVGGTPSV